MSSTTACPVDSDRGRDAGAAHRSAAAHQQERTGGARGWWPATEPLQFEPGGLRSRVDKSMSGKKSLNPGFGAPLTIPAVPTSRGSARAWWNTPARAGSLLAEAARGVKARWVKTWFRTAGPSRSGGKARTEEPFSLASGEHTVAVQRAGRHRWASFPGDPAATPRGRRRRGRPTRQGGHACCTSSTNGARGTSLSPASRNAFSRRWCQ